MFYDPRTGKFYNQPNIQPSVQPQVPYPQIRPPTVRVQHKSLPPHMLPQKSGQQIHININIPDGMDLIPVLKEVNKIGKQFMQGLTKGLALHNQIQKTAPQMLPQNIINSVLPGQQKKVYKPQPIPKMEHVQDNSYPPQSNKVIDLEQAKDGSWE